MTRICLDTGVIGIFLSKNPTSQVKKLTKDEVEDEDRLVMAIVTKWNSVVSTVENLTINSSLLLS